MASYGTGSTKFSGGTTRLKSTLKKRRKSSKKKRKVSTKKSRK